MHKSYKNRADKRQPKQPDQRKILSSTWNTRSQSIPKSLVLNKANIPYDFIRDIYGPVATTSTSVATAGTIQFYLNILNDYANFTNLFDQYRITSIEICLWVVGDTSAETGLISTVVDYNDATNLLSHAAAGEYDNVVTTPLTVGHFRKFTPGVSNAVYLSGVSTGYSLVEAPWLDCSGSSGVPHYGVKYICDVTTSARQIMSRIRYHVQGKNLR